MTETALRSAIESRLDSVVTEIRVHEIERRRNNAVNRVVAEQVMSAGGEQLFHGIGAWTMQPAALFQRLRRISKTRSSPVPSEIPPYETVVRPDRFRHIHRDNVVIFVPESKESRTEFVTFLIVDETHSYFFDHPCDHVPGMLLLEGCAQLAQSAVAKTAPVPPRKLAISAYDVNFQQFVECNVPVMLTARLNAAERNGDCGLPTTVHISISQQNALSGTATFSVAFPN